MQSVISISELASEQLDTARSVDSGRSTSLLVGRGQQLKQVLLALASGHRVADHENPGQATLQVLRGEVTLSSGADEWTCSAGDFVAIPPSRHRLDALSDSVVILTMVDSPIEPLG